MQLDKRLSAVAELIPPGSRVADIGTDHAYLPIWLIKKGICPCAIASDIGKGPLQAAFDNVKANNLTDKIALRLGNGLSSVDPQEADTVVVAGMGGETIVSILKAAPFLKNEAYTLVLQPMTRVEWLRKWLMTEGFSISEEHWIADGRHRYSVMKAFYTGAEPVEDEFYYYIGAFSPEEGTEPRKRAEEHLRRKAAGESVRGNRDEAKRLTDLADRMERFIKRNEALR